MRDTSPGASATYWWSVQRLNNPVGCTTLTRDAPPVAAARSVWARRRAGASRRPTDERIEVDIDKLSGDFEMARRDPAARTARRHGASHDGTEHRQFWRLHDTGTHTLLVRDGDRGLDTGQYDVAIALAVELASR